VNSHSNNISKNLPLLPTEARNYPRYCQILVYWSWLLLARKWNKIHASSFRGHAGFSQDLYKIN